MKTLTKLFDEVKTLKTENEKKICELKSQIQAILNTRFDDWQALQIVLDSVEFCENGTKYCFDQDGEPIAWLRFEALSKMPSQEMEYLEEYVSYRNQMIDLKNSVLFQSLDLDSIFIVDYGRNRGVYQSNKCIIDESEYALTLDQDPDESIALRNKLIEEHVERTGCFPAVFRTNQYDGTLYLIDTKPKKD